MLYHERSGCAIETEKQIGDLEQMTALLQEKLLQVLEAMEQPDAKNLRDCVAVLKELAALMREQSGADERGTGVILLPCVREGAE